MIRVLVVDDQELVRAGIRMILATEPDLELAGEVADGAHAVAAVDECSPDVVLMDIRMPTVNGIEATRAVLAGREQPPKVLVLTTFNADDYVYDALRAGAAGFLLKDAPSDQLVAAIRTVSEGVSLLTPSVTQRLVERFAPEQPPTRDPRLDGLTPREVDVLRSIARGLSNNQIARSLHLSEATIKTHVNHLLTKLDLTSRTQAVVFGYESGLVQVGGTDDP